MARPRKPRRRIPLPGPRLVDVCRRVSKSLEKLPAPDASTLRIFYRFRGALEAADKDERDLVHARARVAALGLRVKKSRLNLRDELHAVDRLLLARLGPMAPELSVYGLGPYRKPGPRGPRRAPKP